MFLFSNLLCCALLCSAQLSKEVFVYRRPKTKAKLLTAFLLNNSSYSALVFNLAPFSSFFCALFTVSNVKIARALYWNELTTHIKHLHFGFWCVFSSSFHRHRFLMASQFMQSHCIKLCTELANQRQTEWKNVSKIDRQSGMKHRNDQTYEKKTHTKYKSFLIEWVSIVWIPEMCSLGMCALK